MAFNFGAFVGGLSTGIVEGMEKNEERQFKFDMLAEEEATKMRLQRSAERKNKKLIEDKIIQGLSAYVGAGHAGAIVKQYGIGGAEQFLNAAQSYDGNFSTAVKLPELKNGVYGEDFASKPLMSLIPQEIEKVDPATTYADWEIRWLDEEFRLSQLPDGQEKTDAITEHEEKLTNYYALIKKREAAKRENEGDEDEPFYTNTERLAIMNKQRDIAYSTITGFAGSRELATEERSGTNIISVSDYIAAINTYNQNSKGANDKNLENDASSAASSALTSINNYAGNVAAKVANMIANNEPLEFGNKEKKPTAILTEQHFNSLAKQQALGTGGVYLLKTDDGKLKVVTYLGYTDVFSEAETKQNYFTHFNISNIDPAKFNAIEPMYFN